MALYSKSSQIAEKFNVTGLNLTFESNTTCASQQKPYTLTVINNCGDGMAGESHAKLVNSTVGDCEIHLEYSSNQGCPAASLGLFLAFVAEYWYIWGAVFILVGLVVSFFGNAFIAFIIFLACGIAGWAFLSWLVFFIVEKAGGDPSVAVGWVIFISCAIVGIIIGYFLAKIRRLAIALIGAGGGVALGFLLTKVTTVNSGPGYYCIIVGCALVAAVLTWFVEDYVIMVATALVGSYLFVRGISFYAGGFPNEFDIGNIDILKAPPSFYGYMGGIIGMFIITLIFQCCRHKSLKEKRAAEEERKRKAKRADHLERFGSDI